MAIAYGFEQSDCELRGRRGCHLGQYGGEVGGRIGNPYQGSGGGNAGGFGRLGVVDSGQSPSGNSGQHFRKLRQRLPFLGELKKLCLGCVRQEIDHGAERFDRAFRFLSVWPAGDEAGEDRFRAARAGTPQL